MISALNRSKQGMGHFRVTSFAKLAKNILLEVWQPHGVLHQVLVVNNIEQMIETDVLLSLTDKHIQVTTAMVDTVFNRTT